MLNTLLQPNYRDSDNDGIVDLLDPTTFGAKATPPDNNGNGFADFLDLGYTSPLPVELVAFQAQLTGKTVKLTWITASERRSDYFEVQRSPDGKTFTTIGQVEAAGESSSLRNYQLTDEQPLADVNYYRLKQVDTDGTTSFSKVQMVKLSAINLNNFTLSVYPNPAQKKVTLSFMADGLKSARIRIMDMSGRVVIQQAVTTVEGDNQVHIELGNLPKGVYLIEFSAAGIMKTQRLEIL